MIDSINFIICTKINLINQVMGWSHESAGKTIANLIGSRQFHVGGEKNVFYINFYNYATF